MSVYEQPKQYIQTNQPILMPDADYTVQTADSGKLIMIPALGGDRTISLPPVQVGLHYRFLVTATLGNDANITTVGLLNGTLLNAPGGGVDDVVAIRKGNTNTASFTAAADKGDYMDLFCDGTAWHISGMSSEVGFS